VTNEELWELAKDTLTTYSIGSKDYWKLKSKGRRGKLRIDGRNHGQSELRRLQRKTARHYKEGYCERLNRYYEQSQG
jgi:hypothetical protein